MMSVDEQILFRKERRSRFAWLARLRSKHQTYTDERIGLGLLVLAMFLAVLFHGSLLLNDSFIHTYDALTHIFFGSHYAQDWFNPWEERWYAGFFTVSYPPLSHYLIALMSKVLGLKFGYIVVQMIAILVMVVGMYRFASLFSVKRAAGYASLLLVFSSVLAETVHLFGQLPTTLSQGLLLNTLPFIWHYIRHGRLSDLIKATAWTGATASAHHVTIIFGSVFYLAPFILILLLASFRRPRSGESAGESLRARIQRRLYRILPRLLRTGLYGISAIFVLLLVIFPYLLWSLTDPINQLTIPHGSRENFIDKPVLGMIFLIVPWLSSFWVLPYVLYKSVFSWRWPILASILLLALLGTGSTTPIPRLLLGDSFDILTLDRFTFWAVMLTIPYGGIFLNSMIHGRLKVWSNIQFLPIVRYSILGFILCVTIGSALIIGNLSNLRKFQPDPIDIEPILSFIEKDNHWRYRYLALGFGDQMAWLSANTRASTPDGNYHSARRLPELTTSPIERLEGAKYAGIPGLGSLEQFITFSEKYQLKYIYSNDQFYDPLLFFSGWHRLNRLENGLMVWEKEDIPPLPERLPPKFIPIYQRVMWGIIPLLMPILALLVLLMPTWRGFSLGWMKRTPLAEFHKWIAEESLPEIPASNWQPWQSFSQRIQNIAVSRKQPFERRLLRSVLSIILLALPFAIWYQELQREETIEEVVLNYWDRLDVKRFEEAYDWLEPQNGLNFDRWLLDFSIEGGLRNGYSKLENFHIREIQYEYPERFDKPKLGDKALVKLDLQWFTALRNLDEERSHELVYTERGWRIAVEPRVQTRNNRLFTRQPDVAFYRTPRRLNVDSNAEGELLERPVLQVLDTRLTRSANPEWIAWRREDLELIRNRQGKPTYDEEQINTIITSEIEDTLERYRTLLTLERTMATDPSNRQNYLPEYNELLAALNLNFRGENENPEPARILYSIVGTVRNEDSYPANVTVTGILRDLDQNELGRNNVQTKMIHKILPSESTLFRIDFNGTVSPEHPWRVSHYELNAKAVVTGVDLERSLISYSRLEGEELEVELANIGTKEATVPHVILGLYDDEGLAWVTESFGLTSILPGGTAKLSAPAALPDFYKVITYQLPPLDVIADPDYGDYRVISHAFYR